MIMTYTEVVPNFVPPHLKDICLHVLLNLIHLISFSFGFILVMDHHFQIFLLPPLILSLVFISLIKHFKITSLLCHSPPLPPGPTPWPIIGNIPHMNSPLPHVTLANFAKKYGPLISLRLGTQRLIVASSPEAAMEVLKTKDRLLSNRYIPHFTPLTKSQHDQSLVWCEECNNNWKHLRTLCRTELFSTKAIDSQEAMREKNISSLTNFLRFKEGEVMKIGELVFATIFNTLGNSLMSKDFIVLGDENEDGGIKGFVREILAIVISPNISDFYPILSKLDLQGLRKKAGKFMMRMQDVWRPIIEERRNFVKANSFRHHDFLDTLLDQDFSDDQIYLFFTELFTAGTDTTTTTIEWIMAELVKNPESMKKVREEIKKEIKQDFPKKFDKMQLPYLEACIKETMRMHPAAPLLLPHLATETCQVMNYTVPKNAEVLVNVWAIGRDPSIWEEPLKFKPERFLNSNIDFKGNDFEFIPFSAGRRMCPGIPMAKMTIPLILVSFIHFFDWSLPNGDDPNELRMTEKFGATTHMEHPLLLLFKARKSHD